MITVLVVDDQRLLREGLRLLLETQSGVSVVAEAGDGAEALAMIDKHRPDVVLADARMPVVDGVALVAACRDRHPGLPVLVLTTFDDDELVRAALLEGASGFLLKDTSPERLVEAIAATRRGELVIDPRVARAALRPAGGAVVDSPLALLTPTERTVAGHVARGRTNGEIAEAMVLAEGTVKNHVSSLLRKLDQRDRTALALLLHRVGSDPR